MTERRFVRGGAEGVEDAPRSVTESQVKAIFEEFGEPAPPVAIMVSGREEHELLRPTEQELTTRGIQYQTHEMSVHSHAALVAKFAETAAMRGIRVIIAAAGNSPVLPAVVASYTDLPVIAVPLAHGPLGGLDTLLATTQMPANAPVAVMSINGTRQAAVFASRILTALPLPPADAE